MSASTITEFLLARIEEDEANAQAAMDWVANGPEPRYPWFGSPGEITVNRFGAAAPHIAAMSPARVLAECAARRSIIESLINTSAAHANETHLGQKLVLAGMDTGLRLALNALAVPYRDHPDYQQVRA